VHVFEQGSEIYGATRMAVFLLAHPLTVVVVVVVPDETTPSRLNVILMNSSYVMKSPNVTGKERSATDVSVQSSFSTKARMMMMT
jgi:hypothetical protein